MHAERVRDERRVGVPRSGDALAYPPEIERRRRLPIAARVDAPVAYLSSNAPGV